jgi:outer membrane protein OmpA-like peptidoglycan-associated protein
MSHLIHKTAIAAGIAFAMTSSAYAVDNLTVDGYAKSSSGETWTSSSGECVRTTYQDTQELLESCGYETVVTESVAVDNQPAGAGVAVMEETQVVKSGEVLADKKEVVAEAFIQNLAFEFNSAELTAADQRELDGVIAKLDPYRPILRENLAHINVIGHTDSVGPAEYNQGLSERRATSVAKYLETVGEVRPERMEISGRGENDPMADNDTDEGRALNRRVVIEVIKH